jgi:hypothetical protein
MFDFIYQHRFLLRRKIDNFIWSFSTIPDPLGIAHRIDRYSVGIEHFQLGFSSDRDAHAFCGPDREASIHPSLSLDACADECDAFRDLRDLLRECHPKRTASACDTDPVTLRLAVNAVFRNDDIEDWDHLDIDDDVLDDLVKGLPLNDLLLAFVDGAAIDEWWDYFGRSYADGMEDGDWM